MRTTATTTMTPPQWVTGHVVFRQYGPPPLPPGWQEFVEQVWQAAAWLDLELPTSVDAIRGARKRLAKEHHPDVGGDAETMKQINAAADLLLRACQ